MKNLIFFLTAIVAFGCSEEKSISTNKKQNIEGTWKLQLAQKIEGADTTYTDYTNNLEAIKIIGGGHFAFFQHDLTKGQDSTAAYTSGAGRYQLDQDHYTEHLQYCSARQWEDNKFEFTVRVTNDSLIQTGVENIPELGVDRVIKEVYTKI